MTHSLIGLRSYWRSKPSIGDLCGGRDNNFNLIRMLAAYAVLVSHSYPLALGRGNHDPLRDLIQVSLGEMAVDIFFVSSGFLIARSLERTPSMLQFARARVLRIYPALWVAIALTVMVVGPTFSQLDLWAYFSSPDAWIYLLRNSILITGTAHTLPGVFADNPYSLLVNASLWTLPYEIFMYACLAAVWWVARARRVQVGNSPIWWVTAMAVLLSGAQIAFVGNFSSNLLRLSAAFFLGSTVYLWRNHIRLHGALVILLLVALVFSQQMPVLFKQVYVLAMPYVLFYLVFVPSGHVRKFNRLGDYSYGTYVYAFPIQQVIAALVGSISVGAMTAYSTVATLCFAVASWHLIERRALGSKADAHYFRDVSRQHTLPQDS